MIVEYLIIFYFLRPIQLHSVWVVNAAVHITGGPARHNKVKPKRWRISTFPDTISITTDLYFSW
jgi:hypothetical protein